MKTRITLLALAATIVTALVASGASALVAVSPSVKSSPNGSSGPGGKNPKDSGDRTIVYTCDAEEERTLTYVGPTSMWPPNHKYRDVTITVRDGNETTADPNDTEGTVSITTITGHDEVVDGEEMNGSGNTENDVVDNTPADADAGSGTALNSFLVRAERSGRGDGRVYSFNSTGTFDGDTCNNTFYATVPHDQGQGSGKPNRGKRSKARRAR